VLNAMAPTPTARYVTAAQLADDLRQFLADRPIKARPPSVAERVGKWARRNPAWAALGLVSLLSLAVVATIVGVYSVQLGQALENANKNLSDANQQNERANTN